jgi:hypothetical protein
MIPPDLGLTSIVMRALHLVFAACLAGLCGVALLISAACAADPAKPYLGMTTEQIIACAGEPRSRYKSGPEAETLTYHYSGAGPVPAPPGDKKKKDKPGLAFFGGKKDKKKGDWTCTASLAFENGRLTQVYFAPKDVRGRYDWQKEKDPVKQEKMRKEGVPTCIFSLPNCHPQ